MATMRHFHSIEQLVPAPNETYSSSIPCSTEWRRSFTKRGSSNPRSKWWATFVSVLEYFQNCSSPLHFRGGRWMFMEVTAFPRKCQAKTQRLVESRGSQHRSRISRIPSLYKSKIQGWVPRIIGPVRHSICIIWPDMSLVTFCDFAGW